MSKQLRKFRKNDYSYDEEEQQAYNTASNYLERRKEKRVERALRTKDVSALTEEDDDWDDAYDYEDRR